MPLTHLFAPAGMTETGTDDDSHFWAKRGAVRHH